MIRRYLGVVLVSMMFSATALAAEGVIVVKSKYDVATTADNLANALESKGLTVFARVDHAAGAAKVGDSLPPTQLVIFGNPKVGTPLMKCQRSVGIDLPQKALVWEDEEGNVWLGYNDPDYLSERHELQACAAVIEKVKNVLANFSAVATGTQ